MNLYQIEQAILDTVDKETGEIIDIEALDALEMERDTKVENIALWIKNLLSDADQINAEREALKSREDAAKNKAERLKKYLANYLNGAKFETPKVKVSFRKSESVDVTDISKIMNLDDADSYLRYKEPEPDKTAIKQAIKSGTNIPGCSLVQKQSISIK